MKKKIVIGIVSVAIIGCIVYGMLEVQKNNANNKKEEAIQKISKIYYEDFLFDMLTVGKSETQIVDFLKDYEENGFTIPLEEIEKVKEIDVKKEMDILKKSCDIKKDNIKIYPQDPYTKVDYKVKSTCE